MAYFDTRTFGSGVPVFYIGSRIITCPQCGIEVKCNAWTTWPLGAIVRSLFIKNFKCPKCGAVICKMPIVGSTVELVTPLIPAETEIPTPTTTPPGEEVPTPPVEAVPPVTIEKIDWTKYIPWAILGIAVIFMGRE